MRNSDIYLTGTGNGFLSRFRWLLLLGFMVSALTCCGSNAFEFLADDNSKEARIEEALIAIDDGNYEKAETILRALQAEYPTDGTVAQYLSNAIAGGAGLDTFNLLETIDQLNDANANGNIDMVGLVLGDADGKLTTDEIDSKLSDLEDAIDSLKNLGDENLTDDQKVQLGLLSLNHAALTIAGIIADDTGSTEVTLTEDGIKALYPSSDADLTGIDDQLSELSEDINNISGSIDAIASLVGGGSENDLSDSFNEFHNDVSGDDDVVTESELENFLNNL